MVLATLARELLHIERANWRHVRTSAVRRQRIDFEIRTQQTRAMHIHRAVGFGLLLVLGCSPDASLLDEQIGFSDLTESAQRPLARAALGANDVSVLFLAKTRGGAELAGLLPVSAGGSLGTLFSKPRFDALVTAMGTDFPDRSSFSDYAAWAIVGMRVDPCAKLRATDSTCTPEIRLVAQPKMPPPLFPFDVPGPMADHAIHLTYRLSAAAFDTALLELGTIYTSTGASAFKSSPLGIHPLIARDGNTGPYATAIKNWILKHTGDARLQIATANFTTGLVWHFRAMTISGSSTTIAPVACSPNPTQKWSFAPSSTSVSGPVLPVPSCLPVTNLMEKTTTLAKWAALSSGQPDAVITEALRLQRPDLRRVGDTDCVSCHQATQRLVTWKGASFLLANDGNQSRYTAAAIPLNSALAPAAPSNTRAFGYFGKSPAISLRTAVETAEVLRQISP